MAVAQSSTSQVLTVTTALLQQEVSVRVRQGGRAFRYRCWSLSMYSLYRFALIDLLTRSKAIQEHIKSLDLQDCKVCIYNVDSQGSEDNIVIQVIGETSNKGEEPKKFVQTFVLARQPSGYFVLNDILRYIKEVPEEESEEAAQVTQNEASVEVPEVEEPVEPEVAPQETPAKEPETAEVTTADVDQKAEDSSPPTTEAPASAVDAPATETAAETPEPVDDKPESTPDPEKVAEEIAEEEAKKPEEPKDPNPTPAVPVVRPVAPVAAEPERPKEPPKPMTWASRAAAAAGPPRPVVPIPKTATPPAPAQARPPVPAAPQPAPAPAAESAPTPGPAKDQGSEWQTAETKRQNRPQSVSGNLTEKDSTMAYIKYVTDKVRDEDLKSTLAGFGELAYFDINRQKVCLCLFLTPYEPILLTTSRTVHLSSSKRKLVTMLPSLPTLTPLTARISLWNSGGPRPMPMAAATTTLPVVVLLDVVAVALTPTVAARERAAAVSPSLGVAAVVHPADAAPRKSVLLR